MRIINKRTGNVIASDAVFARSISAKIRGLMGRREFPEGGALIIPGCRQVHTFFLRFPIDLVFLDKHGRVTRIQERVIPYDISCYCWTASQTIELPAGTVSSSEIRQGDEVAIEDLE